MSNGPTDEGDFSAASHAYEHAEHAADHPTHRVDLTDEPHWPPAPPLAAIRAAGAARPAPPLVVTHRLEAPSAFRLGFGFAAGAWTFRLLVIVGAWTVLAIAITALLARAPSSWLLS